MKDFTHLFLQLDQSNKTTDKLAALKHFFIQADEKDRLWALALFTHRRPKRQLNSTKLRQWTAEYTGIPTWLFEESYQVVGDLAETTSLLLPNAHEVNDKPLHYWINFLQSLGKLEETEKRAAIEDAWKVLDKSEKFVFTKLITGGFRVGVSQGLVTRALSEAFDIPKPIISHRLMGDWKPDETTFRKLVLEESPKENASRPYPFCLAHATKRDLLEKDLGSPAEWAAEWKWDGIRAQLIKRQGKLFIWSRGEEQLTEKFPEFHYLEEVLPDGSVLDGEILPFKEGEILPFARLQTRISRKNLTKNLLQNAPVICRVYDLLEWQHQDIRNQPLEERRTLLLKHIPTERDTALQLSEEVPFSTWEELAQLREQARNIRSEGFMLKKKAAPYEVGRKTGIWWKWKVDPLTIDGVLLYAQKGHGRRANLYTDYTFGVWDGDQLVPFAKAYSGLTDKEIRQLDRFIKQNTLEKFGPVRTVKAHHVFEIAFEGIQASKRHKSGVALRFPRMNRWRQDKAKEEANTLDDLKELLELYG